MSWLAWLKCSQIVWVPLSRCYTCCAVEADPKVAAAVPGGCGAIKVAAAVLGGCEAIKVGPCIDTFVRRGRRTPPH